MMPSTATNILKARQFSGTIFANTDFVQAYLQSASFDTVDEMYASAATDDVTPLDELSATSCLMSEGDKAKLLSVAKYSKIGGPFSGRESAHLIVGLAKLSPAHKLAILSNIRIDWYGILLVDDGHLVRSDLLVPAIVNDEDHEYLRAIVSNPRMDCKFVSEIIHGKAPFDRLEMTTRLLAAHYALGLNELAHPEHFFREDPYDIDVYLSYPSRAALEVVREGISGQSPITERTRSDFFEPFISYYAEAYSLQVHDEAWLTKDVLKATEAPEKWERTSSRNSAVLASVAAWASAIGMEEPLEDRAESDEDSSELGRGSFCAVLLLRSLPRFSDEMADEPINVKELEQNLTSGNWCIRSASYAALFETHRFRPVDEKTVQEARTFVKKYDSDFFALLRGLSLSQRFWRAEEFSLNSTGNSILQDLTRESWNDTRRRQMIAYCEGKLRSLVYPEFQQKPREEVDEPAEKPPSPEMELLRADLMHAYDAIGILSSKLDQTRAWLIGIAILSAFIAIMTVV